MLTTVSTVHFILVILIQGSLLQIRGTTYHDYDECQAAGEFFVNKSEFRSASFACIPEGSR